MKKHLQLLAILWMAFIYQTEQAFGRALDPESHLSMAAVSGNKPNNKPNKIKTGGKCADSKPRPITGNQHPCPGDIEVYSIDNSRGYTSIAWEVPRAEGNNAWEILSGQGTNTVTVRVGEKSGTMKVTVTDPECGKKVATLPVKPGKSFAVTITGPDKVCKNEEQQYKASIKAQGNFSKVPNETNLVYTWTVPAGWAILSGQGTASIKVMPGANAANGEVGVTVEEKTATTGKGNNGKGVGGSKKTFCGTASDKIAVVVRKDCAPVCPAPTVTITGPEEICPFQDKLITFTAKANNTTKKVTYTWELPEGLEIVEGKGASIKVRVDDVSEVESVTVKVKVTNSCGTSATNELVVEVDEDCGSTIPLSAELISFEGEATKSGVLLAWTTATEKDNDRFEVERSPDGLSFTKIGEVKGNGTTSARRTYSLRDAKVSRGTHYYRLKQVDFDGKFEYSRMIAVDYNHAPVNAVAELVVAPNPATSEFSIAVVQAETMQLQILDMNGKVLYTQQISAGARELTFNTAKLGMKHGMYLISVKSAAGAAHAKLVVR